MPELFIAETAPADLLGPEYARYRMAVIHSIPPDGAALVLVDPDRPPE
jgi:hypothetical protein